MNYFQIRDMDVSNGEGVGMALFCSGCPLHCPNCFNQDLWDFNGGKPWTEEVQQKFIDLTNRQYIKRVTFLGGEPLANQNIQTISNIISLLDKTKIIWVYSGYTWEELIIQDKVKYLTNVNVLVDGRYDDSKKDFHLKFKGSSNQRIIDVQKSIEKGVVIEWKI